MPNALDVTGLRFGRLTALHKVQPKYGQTFWHCRCDCGVEKAVSLHHMRRGKIRSCGCVLREYLASEEHAKHCANAALHPRSHGMSKTPVHAVWKSMRQRCANPNSPDYKWHGALGVKVCKRWDKFENFYADMGEPNGLTLDRIDAAGDYEPSNCRWASWDVQQTNKRRACA